MTVSGTNPCLCLTRRDNNGRWEVQLNSLQFNNHLLSVCSMPGTLLGARGASKAITESGTTGQSCTVGPRFIFWCIYFHFCSRCFHKRARGEGRRLLSLGLGRVRVQGKRKGPLGGVK